MLTGIKEELTYEIEKLVKEYKMSYMDAVLFYCEKNSFTEEYVGSLIIKNAKLKEKIEAEAVVLRFLKNEEEN